MFNREYLFENRFKIIFGVALTLVLVGGSILMWSYSYPVSQLGPIIVEEDVGTSTGVKDEGVAPEQDNQAVLSTVLLGKLPIRLPTATVTYVYKKSKLQIEYCGDFQRVMDDFRIQLVELGYGKYTFSEDDIIFSNLGECPGQSTATNQPELAN